MAEDKKLDGKIKKKRDVSAENDQLGENKHEGFSAAREIADESESKKR